MAMTIKYRISFSLCSWSKVSCYLLLICMMVTNVSGFRFSTSYPRRIQHLRMESGGSTILRRIDKWACVKQCGACCKLGPVESRPDLAEYLSAEELVLYKSMIGPDDWCVNFDKESRMCKIYDTRPGFCIVDPKKFKKMFDVEEADLNVSCLNIYLIT